MAGDPARDNQETPQFLKADAKGRVFLLHGDNLAVDQILPSGKIVPGRTPHGREASAASVKDAALSPDGSSWLLRSGPDEVFLLSGGDQREFPTPNWWISAVAYTADGPVVAVLPAWVGGTDATGRTGLDKPPFLLRLDGQKWQTLSMQTPSASAQEPPAGLSSSFEVTKEERDLRLVTGRKGALWTAQQNAYLLKRYSRQGAVEESVVVKGGNVQWKERTEEDWKARETAAQAAGSKFTRSRHAKTAPVRVVHGLTAQDNRVYLVVETPEGLALDRWNDETEILDRLLLAGIAPGRGYLGMAAGRDGLYIAACGLGEPIWRLDWQRLEDAKWTVVPEVVAQRPRKQ
ncbi:MAG TPA: hypothetical protein VJA16_02250 [Thermoanaerobaculia bacterium]